MKGRDIDQPVYLCRMANRDQPSLSPERELGVLRFFFLTFGLTWVAWGIANWLIPATGLRQPLVLLGVFAPGIMAVALTYHRGGAPAARTLLGAIGRWRVAARWYAFAIGYMATAKVIVALLHRLMTGAWPTFGTTPVLLMLVAIPTSTLVQAGEELGWRGYALPRLTRRLGLGPASILLGGIWAVWHLPLFYMQGADTYGQSFPMYMAQVIALSVAMAWLFARTRGSLLLVMLMHAAVNNTKDIVPSATAGASDALAWGGSRVGWLTVGVLWIGAAYCLVRMRGASTADVGAPVVAR